MMCYHNNNTNPSAQAGAREPTRGGEDKDRAWENQPWKEKCRSGDKNEAIWRTEYDRYNIILSMQFELILSH